MNAAWRAKRYQEKSYPGEIATRRKRTLELQVTFLCEDPIFFSGRNEGSDRYLGASGAWVVGFVGVRAIYQ